jgi:hypothetical protein
MDVATDRHRRPQLKQHWLIKQDPSSSHVTCDFAILNASGPVLSP